MEKLFKLQEKGTTVSREIFAGLTTFLTMAYILAVNPDMLSKVDGMPWGGVFTATAIAAAVATIMMALTANLPIALAPGMGLNAFFTFTVCMGMRISWQLALTAVFVEGLIFILLSLFNVREAIVKAIPPSLKKAVAVGIGLFIAYIGMKNAGFLHFISDINILPDAFSFTNDAGVTTYPGQVLPGADIVPEIVVFNQSGQILALIGLAIIFVLHVLKVPGAILIGIFAATLIGIPMGITTVPDTFSIVKAPDAPLLFQFDFNTETLISFKFIVVIFTFLFVDIFDTVGTLVGVTTKAGLVDGKGGIPRVKQAFLSDAVGTAVGAALGTSTVTSYVESAAGVSAGGRTGLTSLTTGILFLIALFFSDLFLLIPGAATAPALIFVGFLMLSPVMSIDFNDPVEGIPAFMAIIMMPFAYSIAEGIVYGIIAYVLLKFVTKKAKDVSMITWFLFAVFVARFFLH